MVSIRSLCWWWGSACLRWTLFSLSIFFNAAASTDIYTLSLHDALPISRMMSNIIGCPQTPEALELDMKLEVAFEKRSEEHTSELQSLTNLVCRLLLEKKKTHRHEHSRP